MQSDENGPFKIKPDNAEERKGKTYEEKSSTRQEEM